jgi:ABC-type Zn uptake system ZnuABC Zn-binding protein ZnuA
LNIDLFLEPKPGIPPSPAHLANVVKTMKADNVRAVIVEPFQNRKTAEFVAAQTNAQVVEFAQYPGGVKGTEGGYIQLMDHLVGALAKALGGK